MFKLRESDKNYNRCMNGINGTCKSKHHYTVNVMVEKKNALDCRPNTAILNVMPLFYLIYSFPPLRSHDVLCNLVTLIHGRVCRYYFPHDY